ncbi:hypothetical protein C7212DRAFT_366837 [Tuber magnatum]|uniref:Uncharacterized protein n=1 Tax=Tuber magnatum TaxID=42249 RepID=A0A317SD21_9PEZI|nr:hypothetical protein C7212DRAFT_366837 [Tuber magnatum]
MATDRTDSPMPEYSEAPPYHMEEVASDDEAMEESAGNTPTALGFSDTTPISLSMTRSASSGSQRGRKNLPFHRGAKVPDLFRVGKGKEFPSRPNSPAPPSRGTVSKKEVDQLAARMGQAMANFAKGVAQTEDAQNIALSELSENDQQLAGEMEEIRQRIMSGEVLNQDDTKKWASKITSLEVGIRLAQNQFRSQVDAEMLEAASRQQRHEQISEQLHSNIGTTEQQSLNRDLLLEQEVDKLKSDRVGLQAELKQQQVNRTVDRELQRDMERRHEKELNTLKAQMMALMKGLDNQRTTASVVAAPSVVELPPIKSSPNGSKGKGPADSDRGPSRRNEIPEQRDGGNQGPPRPLQNVVGGAPDPGESDPGSDDDGSDWQNDDSSIIRDLRRRRKVWQLEEG